MKIRNGFVSNSSSSSFVVQVKSTKFDQMWDKADGKTPTSRKVSEEQEEALLEYGFRHCADSHASHIEGGRKPRVGKTHMYFQVPCNEDEVIHWLVENGISFEAACHYGHESVFFDSERNELIFAPNFGLSLETYKSSRTGPVFDAFYSKGSISKCSREEYLKDADSISRNGR